MDIGLIKLILSHAAAVHGLPVKVEPVDLARIDRLITHLDTNPHQTAPVSRIKRFSVATAMHQEEICKVRWSDLESRTRMLLIRDGRARGTRKANNQRIPLFPAAGYDAWAIVEDQEAKRSNDDDRIFRFNP